MSDPKLDGLSEEERLAAEWAALADEGTDGGGGGDDMGGGTSTRVLNQDEIDSLLGFDSDGSGDGDNSGLMALVNSALVNYERLPMLEVVFDRLVRMMSTSLAQFHLRQRRSQPRPDLVGPVRRLPELDPAAGHAVRLQGGGMGQLRPDGRRQRPDLLDRRRAAGRPARHRRDAYRRPPLHHDRAQSGRTHGPCGPQRPVRRLRPAVARRVPLRPAGNQPALRHHRPAGQRRRAGEAAHRHGRPRRPAGTADPLRDAGAGARAAAPDVHGREVRP